MGCEARTGLVDSPTMPPIIFPSAVYAATANMYFSLGVSPLTFSSQLNAGTSSPEKQRIPTLIH